MRPALLLNPFGLNLKGFGTCETSTCLSSAVNSGWGAVKLWGRDHRYVITQTSFLSLINRAGWVPVLTLLELEGHSR